MKRFSIVSLAALILVTGCVYYNTYYLAKKYFKEAESTRKRSGMEIQKGGKNYQKAIEKASKVLEFHPDSKYVDDALFLIGRSFYHQGEFSKAETKFRELLATYPESEYAEESIFFLGKTYFWQEDYIGAKEVFEKIDSISNNKELRSEAMFMLGEILYAQKEYDYAVSVFQDYLDEFGKGERSGEIQFKIAKAYYLEGDYIAAKDAFLKVLKLNAPDTLKFQSTFNAGDCFYEVEQFDSGLAIFDKLAKDEKNFKEMPALYLQLAKGKKLAGDLDATIEQYRKLIEEYPRTNQSAMAFYYLGIIYQDEFYDLDMAKNMYDSSTAMRSNISVSKDAFSRSANIAKLETYRSGRSGDEIDKAEESQYLLAELYLTQFDQPDSALHEYQILLDSFPDSKFAPPALLAIGWLKENVYDDTTDALVYFNRILDEYPSSDQVPDALDELGIDSDTVDYDYPARRYSNAEQVLFSMGNYDSANVIFQSIIDDFPESEYAAKATWAVAWSLSNFYPITDPDSTDSGKVIIDSTFILAYQKVAELYPETEYGISASDLLQGKVPKKPQAPEEKRKDGQDTMFAEAEFDSMAYQDSVSRAIEKELRELPLLNKAPTTLGEFEYPISAYSELWEGSVELKIKIDFTGKVIEWVILRGSGIEDIDNEVEKSIKETYFNPADVDPLDYGKTWFRYTYQVRLPEGMRNELNK